jgi:hypothetical protein
VKCVRVKVEKSSSFVVINCIRARYKKRNTNPLEYCVLEGGYDVWIKQEEDGGFSIHVITGESSASDEVKFSAV